MSHRYEEIAILLKNRILEGEYPFGKAMPTEHCLMREFGVSRVTIRRALQELVDAGLVDRRRKRGTIPTFRPPVAPVRVSVTGLLDLSLRIGMRTGIIMKTFEYIPAPESVAKLMRLESDAVVQHVVRVRTLQGSPFSYVTTYVPERIGSRFTYEDLARHPMMVLFDREGITIHRVEQTVKAVSADSNTAAALCVPTGSALLHMSRVAFDQYCKAVQHLIVLYPPDRYEYRMSLVEN